MEILGIDTQTSYGKMGFYFLATMTLRYIKQSNFYFRLAGDVHHGHHD